MLVMVMLLGVSAVMLSRSEFPPRRQPAIPNDGLQ